MWIDEAIALLISLLRVCPKAPVSGELLLSLAIEMAVADLERGKFFILVHEILINQTVQKECLLSALSQFEPSLDL
jgi:hypothetical protein